MSSPATWPGLGSPIQTVPQARHEAAIGSAAQIAVGVVLALLYLVSIGTGQAQMTIGLIAISALVAVAWPAAGLAMFALVMPLREADVLVPVRANAIICGSIALGCILRLPIDRPPLRLNPGIVLLLGYLLISGLSILPMLSGHPADWAPSAVNILLRLSTGVVLFISASYLFRQMSSTIILALAIVGTTVAALLGLADILGFLPFEAITQGLLDDTGGLRASGAFADPNFFGLYMATAAVFLLGVLGVVRLRARLVLLPVVALLLVCVALSYSRGAYVGTVAGILVLVWLRSRTSALILLVAFAILAVTLYPAFLEARQGEAISSIDRYAMLVSQETRTKVAIAGLALFAAHPVFGVGFGVFQFASPAFIPGGTRDSTFSHNQYLNILAEQGIVGALIVGAIAVTLIVALIRSTSPLRRAALAMLATFVVASLFLHTATVFQSMSLMWLILAVVFAPGPLGANKPREA